MKFDKTLSADELDATNDATLQALISGPKGLGHVTALEKYIDEVCVQIKINHAMEKHDAEASGHLQVLKALVEMSSFTLWLPGGIPIVQTIDVRGHLRIHLQYAQEILQKRRDNISDKDAIDPVLADLVDMEAKVARAVANIEISSEEAHIRITMK